MEKNQLTSAELCVLDRYLEDDEIKALSVDLKKATDYVLKKGLEKGIRYAKSALVHQKMHYDKLSDELNALNDYTHRRAVALKFLQGVETIEELKSAIEKINQNVTITR